MQRLSRLPVAVTVYVSNAEDRCHGLFRHPPSWCQFDLVFLWGGFLWQFIIWLRLVKNLTPWEEKSAYLIDIVYKNYKGAQALGLNKEFA
jgi:hypothetical protein